MHRRIPSYAIYGVCALIAALLVPNSAGLSAAVASGPQLLSTSFSPTGTEPVGITPEQIENYYGLNALGDDSEGAPITGEGETIAVLLWNNNAYAAQDLNTFIHQFDLPAMNGLTGPACSPDVSADWPCFSVVNTDPNLPAATQTEDAETASDIDWAHVAAPDANIILVQTEDSSAGILQGINAAVATGAQVVSMSFFDRDMTAADDSYFQSSSTGFVSGNGDDGWPQYLFPGASPYVLSVGGTALSTKGETAWIKSGGGVESSELRPGYQRGWTTSTDRSDNDVAYNAIDYPVYVSYPSKSSWYTVNGVSLGIPQWSGIVADADQLRDSLGKGPLASSGLPAAMYLAAGHNESSSDVINQAYFRDITTGSSNGYSAGKGYDQLTGIGSPKAPALVNFLGYDE